MAEKLYLITHRKHGGDAPTFVTTDHTIAYIVAGMWLGEINGHYKELKPTDSVPMNMVQNPVRKIEDAKAFVEEDQFDQISVALYAQKLFGITEEEWKATFWEKQEEAFEWAGRAQTAAAENA